MAKIRFLLDENVDPLVLELLRQREPAIDIKLIGDDDAPPLSTDDETILSWIEKTGYVLVTHNRRSMPRHLHNHFARGGEIPGILLIRRKTLLGPLLDELQLIWVASAAEEYLNRIQHIPM